MIYPDNDRGAARLLVTHDEACDPASVSHTPFDAKHLLPLSMQKALHGRAFAVLPLAIRDLSLGHILLELNLDSASSYDAMADAIANGLNAASLVGRRG